MKKHNFFVLILAFLMLTGCQNQSSKTADTSTASSDETTSTEIVDKGPFCYAGKTRVENTVGGEEAYNYEFIRLNVGEDNRVDGVIHVYPYGTDAMVGSIAGIYDREANAIKTEATLLAEGDRYTEQRDYRLLENAVDLGYTDGNGKAALLPKVSCEEYDALFKESQLGRLRNLVNSTDRTRLLKSEAIKKRGYSREKLNSVQFLEREVDLDRNYETQEFLLYVIDPEYCGTGGCELLVINDKGKTLSSISAVKLPVYSLVQTVEDNKSKEGSFKELFVWSQGLRRLVPENGKYPDNASMEPVASEELMTNHPEQYIVLLDYLD